MAITFNTLQSFSSISSQNAGVYGLYTNSAQGTDVTTSLFGSSKPKQGTLSETQQTTISQLQDYVKENLTGQQAEALQKDIEGLSQLYKFGNSSASFGALSQLLGNTSSFGNLTSGSLINQLV